jgi:hypothetical protein
MRALFDSPPDGTGAAAWANDSGAASARVTVGVGVSGMYGARLATNPGRWVVVPANRCPPAPLAASVSAGLASFAGGTPAFTDLRLVSCWQDLAD